MSRSTRKIVFCVDDNVDVLNALRRQLRRGLDGKARIEVASSAAMALDRLEALADAERVAVVIVSDWLMPNMRGDTFIAEVERRFGKLPVVVLSGHITEEAAKAFRDRQQVIDIIPKPWPDSLLLDTVHQALDSFDGGLRNDP